MWLKFQPDELATLRKIAADNPQLAALLCKQSAPDRNRREPIRHVQIRCANDDLECDDDAVTNMNDEGTWVMTWVWVPHDEILVEDDDVFELI